MENTEPEGELVIRTLAMPKDTNGNGDIFGGWILSQMDLGAGILAMKVAKKRVTTVAIDKIVFAHPVRVGDTVNCYAKLLKIGNTSMTMQLQAWVINIHSEEMKKVAESIFTYVALDEKRRPTPVNSTS